MRKFAGILGLLTCVLLPLSIIVGSANSVTFEKYVGGPLHDYGRRVMPTTDGGYIMCGHYDVDAALTESKAYLVRLEADGDTLWTRVFGESGLTHYFRSVAELPDGGFIAVGGKRDVFPSRAFLVRTDANGDTLWTRYEGNEYNTYVQSMCRLQDSSLAIAGKEANIAGTYPVFLLRINADGDTLSYNQYNIPNDYNTNDIIQLSSGEIILTGQINIGGIYNGYVLCLDSLRTKLWDETIEHEYYLWLDGVAEAGPSMAMAAGTINIEPWTAASPQDPKERLIMKSTASTAATGEDDMIFALIDASPTGGVVWARQYGTSDDDFIYDIDQYSEDLLIATGGLTTFSSGISEGRIVLVDTKGDTLGSWTHGRGITDWFYGIEKTLDDGYVTTGPSFNGVDYDAIIVKDDIPPIAWFMASETIGDAPFTVQFKDVSTFEATSWEWDFDGDGQIDDTAQNPDYTYNSFGNHSVTLIASNASQVDTVTKHEYISVDTDTYYVAADGSGDFPTVQAAIDSASNGHVIELGDGTFTGTGNYYIDLHGKSITVRSRSGQPELCIISGYMAFYIHSGEDTTTVLEGISIIDSNMDSPGAAIHCTNGSSPKIRNCVFNNNYSSKGGGAIACLNTSNPIIENCIFSNNSSPYWNGGAILCRDGSSPSLIDCIITGNIGEWGGGIACIHGSSPTISGCSFLNNSSSFEGGGIYCYSGESLCSPSLDNCTFYNNTAGTGYAGGVFIDRSNQAVTSCTFYNNTPNQIYCWQASPTITNTIIAFNSQEKGLDDNEGSPTLECCNVYGNAGGDWVGCIADQYGINGNISEDPIFCDSENGDLTLNEYSPCAATNNPTCGDIGAWSVGCITADFSADPTQGIAPLTVQFEDLTLGNPDRWEWDFQNDGIVDDTTRDPSFEYLVPGYNSVKLKVFEGDDLIACCIKENNIWVLEDNNMLIHYTEITSSNPTSVPVSFIGSDSIGAVSLYFDYDDTKLTYEGIHSNVPGELFSGGVIGDKISVQWFDETGGSDPIIPGVDPDTIFAIQFSAITAADCTQVTFDTTQCILGNKVGDPISDILWVDDPPFGSVYINIGAVVSGRVGYYWLDGPVPGSTLSMGSPNPDVLSDDLGLYEFDPYSYGNYVLHISKTDDLNGINSLDAIKVIRHSTGQELFNNSYKELAANVNGDGNINALDAIKIIRASVGLEPLASGDWTFDPDSVVFNPLTQNQTEDLIGIRMGDVNGDWEPYSGPSLLEFLAGVSGKGLEADSDTKRLEFPGSVLQTITVYLPSDTISSTADSVSFAVDVSEFYNIGAISLRIAFDDTILAYDRLESNCGVGFTSNLVGSEIRIEWFDPTGGVSPLNIGDGTLLTLYFDVIGDPSELASLVFLPQSMLGDAIGDPIEDVLFLDGDLYITTDAGDIESTPTAFKLHQCYPNPFNPVTTITFDIPGSVGASVATTIKVYDVSGRLVRELIKRNYSPGKHTVTWDGRNDSGLNASSGVYFFHLTAGEFSDTKKMILLR